MWLSQLTLANFRNLRRLELELRPGLALFCGRNGQGKTNLLESVHVLATTRSPRTSSERELLSWQAPEDVDLAAVVPPFARVEGRVRRLQGEVHLEVTFEADRPVEPEIGAVARAIKVNGLPTRAAGLIGQLPVVYFSPEDVALAGGPPAGRRQYLNVANSQVSSAYLRALQRYNRVLLQRNQVLRQVRERRQPSSAIEPWTEQLIEWGTSVLEQRLRMVAAINERVGTIFGELAGSSEDGLRIGYRSTAGDGSADLFRTQQERLAGREVDQAASLIGPHRDDFSFALDGVDLNTYGSRGQQRLAVLALKLAEADWMQAEIGESPILLLDDVLSELDSARRGYVVRRVGQPGPDGQVWISATDLASFAPELLSEGQRFEIDAGQLRRA